MITLNDVTKKFGSHVVLDSISMTIRTSNISGLCGKNGSGKTTFLNIIAGLSKINSGSIINKASSKKVIFDAPPHLHSLSVQDYLNFFSRLYANKPMSNDAINEILKLIKLEEYKDKKISSLSFGMEKKLYIATALINPAELMIFDEPFNGLDFESIEIVKKIFIFVKNNFNSSVIVSSHLLSELKSFCDNYIIIENKKLKIIDKLYTNNEIRITFDFPFSTRVFDIYPINILRTSNNFIDVSIPSNKTSYDIITLLTQSSIRFNEIYYLNSYICSEDSNEHL